MGNGGHLVHRLLAPELVALELGTEKENATILRKSYCNSNRSTYITTDILSIAIYVYNTCVLYGTASSCLVTFE